MQAEWIDWIPERNYGVRPSRAEERRVIALCKRVGRPVPPEVEQWANEPGHPTEGDNG